MRIEHKDFGTPDTVTRAGSLAEAVEVTSWARAAARGAFLNQSTLNPSGRALWCAQSPAVAD